MIRRLRARIHGDAGQSVLEFGLMLPLVVVLVLGVVELSWALLDQHVVTKLTREGSNLISRDTTLQAAATALRTMATRPVDFSGTNSKVIFSVIRQIDATGSTNFGKPVLFQRFESGGLSAASTLTTVGSGTFGGAPDYAAVNPDTDASLQITNLPTGTMINGSMLYVTEIYTTHTLLTPFNRFGVTVPNTLYSIAYF
jgi:TadE-like protein